MTANSATAAPVRTGGRARTGGPGDDGPKVLEHVLGWVLVAVVAMLVTQLGLL
ncbi:SCO1431 family membrane protein [Streptomyces sp. 4F14]|uniref:SCO1431 family membrane protein n=1 Tax=Streptomyces sp. 4F14 TaxID=3394380 RepID=UPI003A848AA6